MMASTPNGVSDATPDLLPPADRQFRVRNAGWLLLQVVWMCLLAVPAIIVRLLRAIFPPTGKSLAGQVVIAAREFLPAMKGRNAGHIVAIGSMSALQGCANITAYAATKFGLRGFMDSLRDELEERQNNNIKTTIVFPYFMNTSENYTRRWNVRMPPMKTGDVADAIMIGIKREEVTVTVPERLYFGAHFIRIMPLYIRDMARRIFYVKISPSTREEKACLFEPVVKDISHVIETLEI